MDYLPLMMQISGAGSTISVHLSVCLVDRRGLEIRWQLSGFLATTEILHGGFSYKKLSLVLEYSDPVADRNHCQLDF